MTLPLKLHHTSALPFTHPSLPPSLPLSDTNRMIFSLPPYNHPHPIICQVKVRSLIFPPSLRASLPHLRYPQQRSGFNQIDVVIPSHPISSPLTSTSFTTSKLIFSLFSFPCLSLDCSIFFTIIQTDSNSYNSLVYSTSDQSYFAVYSLHSVVPPCRGAAMHKTRLLCQHGPMV